MGHKTEPIGKGVGKGGILGPEGNRGVEENLTRMHCVHKENCFCLFETGFHRVTGWSGTW